MRALTITYGCWGSRPELSKQMVDVRMGPPSSSSAQKLSVMPL